MKSVAYVITPTVAVLDKNSALYIYNDDKG